MANKSVFKPNVLKAKGQRNAFSLAHTTAYHAPFGALLPVAHYTVPANSYFEMDMENQTIMRQLVRPAFSLLKEHFEVFAVPMCQLHQAFDNFITSQSNYDNSAIAFANINPGPEPTTPLSVPMFAPELLANALYRGYNNYRDDFGLRMSDGMTRILDLLGYGNYYELAADLDPGDSSDITTSTYNFLNNTLPMNFYNLLAYQKIYYSAYSNPQYESRKTYAFNIDDIGQNQAVINDTDWSTVESVSYGTFNAKRMVELCRMHYRWNDKDYFTSVKPYILPNSSAIGFEDMKDSATWGNVWQLFGVPGTASNGYNSLPSVISQTSSNNNTQSFGDSVKIGSAGAANSAANLEVGVNVSAVRFAFAFDKLLRRMREAGPSFNMQMLAQFGIKPIDERHGEVKRLGGWTNNLRLSEVTSSADSGGSDLGDLGAKMTSYSQNGKKIKYQAKEDCIIMVMYSTSIKNQYSSFRYDRSNLRRYRFDWFNPAFENLGLQPIFTGEYSYVAGNLQVGDAAAARDKRPLSEQKAILGYTKRYMEYKTKPNEVHGLFQYQYHNASMMPWVTQHRDIYQDVNAGNIVYLYHNMTAFTDMELMVSPFTLNTVLQYNQDGTWETDAFNVFAYFNAKLIANMSIDGEDF